MDKEGAVCVYEHYMYMYTYTYIYNGLLLSHSKEWNNAICSTLLDLEIIILNEVSQTKTNICYHLYVKPKKKKRDKWTYL